MQKSENSQIGTALAVVLKDNNNVIDLVIIGIEELHSLVVTRNSNTSRVTNYDTKRPLRHEDPTYRIACT